jgi:hypothetical protein
VNPAIDGCGARPIQGPGRGRVSTLMGPHVMRLIVSAFGSEMHALRTEAACSCTCGSCDGVPGVVHTFTGVGTMGRCPKRRAGIQTYRLRRRKKGVSRC